VAFAPDGINGWIGVIGDGGSVPISAGRSNYPILWQTTDGGQTWEGPVPTVIAGEDAPIGILNFLSDNQLVELFGVPIPPREEIEFTTAYDFDLHVDAWGQPHIAVVVGVTGEGPYSFTTNISIETDFMFAAPFDLTYNNDYYIAYKLGPLKTFRGQFGDLTEDNRIQIASSWDGEFMFFTWLDTHLPGVEENCNPDVWTRGLNVQSHLLSHYWDTTGNSHDKPINITEFTEAMWQAYFQATSHYVIFGDGDPYYSFIMPVVYEDMNPEDPSGQVQFKYISNFRYFPYNFFGCYPPPGISETTKNYHGLKVTNNSPNPEKLHTTFSVTLEQSTKLSIDVCNIAGQKVFEMPPLMYQPGVHPVTLNMSPFPAGVYFYSVASSEQTVTGKMIVE